MVRHCRNLRGGGLQEVTDADLSFGRFHDGWWEVVLEDPRPGSDEALFVEDVYVALFLPSGGHVCIRAFNCHTRDQSAQPHPLSRPPILENNLPAGFHLLHRRVGHRARYLRVTMSGEAHLHGVEAFCVELLPPPPGGTLRQSAANAVRAYQDEPAVATKVEGRYETLTYRAVSSEVRSISGALRAKLALDEKVLGGSDVLLAWCGATSLEAVLCFLACMCNQWCFCALQRRQLQRQLALLPQLALLVVEAEDLQVPTISPSELRALRHPGPMTDSPEAPLDRLGSLIFTSGSTGQPKAVRRSHAELYAFLWLYAKAVSPDRPVHLAYQPYAHMNEQLGTAAAFLQGTCVAFSSGETAHADAKAIEPTGIQGVPRFYEPLLSAYEAEEMTLEELRLSLGGRLHSVSVGSAHASRRLLDFLRLCFESSSCSVTNSYGATEVGPIAHNGLVNPNVEVRIVPCAELGHDPGGSVGEVRVRCKNSGVQAREYLGASMALDGDGFYCTGDVARYEGGYLELVGRVGNVTKLGNGLYVSVESLEEKYVSMVKELDQVFVIALPSESSVFAACVQHPWSLLGKDQLLSTMKQAAEKTGLAKHEVVSEIFLEPEPWTSANGALLENQKLNRPALLDRYRPKEKRAHDSMEMVRLAAEAQRRGVQMPLLPLLEADLAAELVEPAAAPRTGPTNRFLVTGGSGLLGRELIAELLRQKKQVLALVRRPCTELPDVEQVLSDVARASLSGDLRDKEFDAVLHSAAEVSWASSYEQLRSCNVLGTWQLARICATRGVPLFYVSTISVAKGESEMLPPAALANGYVLSKLSAESFVQRAFEKGLQGTILRPGMLWGNSRTGRGRPGFFPERFVGACRRLRCAPGAAAVCDVTPADYAAQVMVQLSLQPPLQAAVNIYNPRSPSYLQLSELLSLPPVPLPEFWAKVRQDRENPMAALEPLLRGGLPAASNWGDTRLQQALQGRYSPPEVTKDLLQLYMRAATT